MEGQIGRRMDHECQQTNKKKKKESQIVVCHWNEK